MDVRNSHNNGRRRVSWSSSIPATSVRDATSSALIVAEAMHGTASADVPELIETLSGELGALWSVTLAAVVLSQSAPRFTSAT